MKANGGVEVVQGLQNWGQTTKTADLVSVRGSPRHDTCKSLPLQWVIINKSDEIVAGAGDFGAKSPSIINYTIRIFPF